MIDRCQTTQTVESYPPSTTIHRHTYTHTRKPCAGRQTKVLIFQSVDTHTHRQTDTTCSSVSVRISSNMCIRRVNDLPSVTVASIVCVNRQASKRRFTMCIMDRLVAQARGKRDPWVARWQSTLQVASLSTSNIAEKQTDATVTKPSQASYHITETRQTSVQDRRLLTMMYWSAAATPPLTGLSRDADWPIKTSLQSVSSTNHRMTIYTTASRRFTPHNNHKTAFKYSAWIVFRNNQNLAIANRLPSDLEI